MLSNGKGKSQIHFKFQCRSCGRTLSGKERHLLRDRCRACNAVFALIAANVKLSVLNVANMVLGRS